MRINWTEVSKFLSGAFFVGAIVSAYFYFQRMDAPFLGITIPADIIGLRGVVHALLFALCFYVGYLRKPA
jgi:hypothetical protein